MFSNSVISPSIVVLVVLNLIGGGLSCFSAFKNIDNITFVQMDCAKSAGFEVSPSKDDLSMDSFDDKVKITIFLNNCNRYQVHTKGLS